MDNFAGRHHTAAVTSCRCEAECATLVRLGLWPATPSSPVTGFTMALMELCRAVQVEGQLPLQKFCKALGQQMGLFPRPAGGVDLYRALRDALIEFHHHQLSCMETAKSPALGRGCPLCTQVSLFYSLCVFCATCSCWDLDLGRGSGT
jgi:hypothetical protein